MGYKRYYYRYAALIVLTVFAFGQFVLILRHKSPYTSDSYFYKHMYYQHTGVSFEEAQKRIQNEFDLKNADDVGKKIFGNDEEYKNTYEFFKKRPFYPFVSYIFLLITHNDYISLLLPPLLAYIGSIYFVLFFFKESFNKFFSYLGTFLFISFYPFLDWSTYFMTDTIGFFFWLFALYCSYRYVQTHTPKWLYIFSIVYTASLTNREQGIFMVFLYAIVWFYMSRSRFINSKIKRIKKIFLATASIAVLYILISKLLGLKNLWDTIIYTQNSYGLYPIDRSVWEVFSYLGSTIVAFHLGLIKDLMSHHWWSVFTLLGIVGLVHFLYSGRKTLVEIIVVASGIASYSCALAYPVLSYRYFYPVVLMLIYFACWYMKFFFSKERIIGRA